MMMQSRKVIALFLALATLATVLAQNQDRERKANGDWDSNKYSKLYEFEVNDVINQNTGENSGISMIMDAWSPRDKSFQWSKYELGLEVTDAMYDVYRYWKLYVLLQFTWVSESGEPISESVVVRYYGGGEYVQLVAEGLVDPNNEISQPVNLKHEQPTSDNNYFTPNTKVGPQPGQVFDSRTQQDPYVGYDLDRQYQDYGTIQRNGREYYTAQFFIKRADTSNKLNKLSVGLFFIDGHSYVEDHKFYYPYFFPFPVPDPEPEPVPAGEVILQDPYFWNLYGYSQFLVGLLYYPTLLLVFTGPFAPILMTIPMFILMGYILLQPSLFADQYPDRVQWDDEMFQSEVVDKLFSTALWSYLIPWIFAFLYPLAFIPDIAIQVSNGTFPSTQSEYLFTITWALWVSQVLYFFIQFGFSVSPYFDWRTPEELKDVSPAF